MDPKTAHLNPDDSAAAASPDRREDGWRKARVVLGVYWIALATGTHWPRFHADLHEPKGVTDPLNAIQIDKGLHLVAFGLLGFLMIRARPWGRRLDRARSAAVAAMIALVYAPIDEFTQALAIERSPSLSDLTANTLGILCVYLLVNDARAQSSGPRRGLTGRAATGVVLGGAILSWSRGALGMALSGAALAWSQWVLLFSIGLATTLLLAGYRRSTGLLDRVGLGLAIGWVALSAPLIEICRGLAGLPVNLSLLMAQEVGLVAALSILAGRQIFAAWRGHPSAAPLCPNTGGAAT